MRAAERLDQPVIAAAAKHRALRAQPLGDELERGVAVIIEAAHQPRRAGPAHACCIQAARHRFKEAPAFRSEEHTSELQSLMRTSYAVSCLKKKTKKQTA